MSETIVVPDNGNNNNGWNSPLGLLALGNGGYGYGNGGFLGGGFGAGILGGVLGGIFTNWLGGNGWGMGGMNGNGAAAALGAQATANNNTDLLMNAINGTDADVRLLATTLNSDVNEIRSGLNTINLSAQQVGATVGLTGQQVINAIQQGNMGLAQQLCDCCCKMQQQVLTQGYESRIQNMQQTETIGNAINGNGRAITDAIASLQTNITKEFCDVKEREMQSKIDTQAEIITQLRNAENNAMQTSQIAAMIAPLQAKLVEIENRQPATVSVPYPQLSVVNTTPYMGGFYGNGFNGWGYGYPGGSYWG